MYCYKRFALHTQPFTSSRELMSKYVILLNVCNIKKGYHSVAVHRLLPELTYSHYLVLLINEVKTVSTIDPWYSICTKFYTSLLWYAASAELLT